MDVAPPSLRFVEGAGVSLGYRDGDGACQGVGLDEREWDTVGSE